MAKRSTVGAKKSPLKLGEQVSSSRLAMVAPPPAKPSKVLSLAEILKLLGNDRAYTVIISKPNSFKIHFEGDRTMSTIKLVNGKPVITKEDD
jgi:D-alanyl-D-alanine carboxypeptidase